MDYEYQALGGGTASLSTYEFLYDTQGRTTQETTHFFGPPSFGIFVESMGYDNAGQLNSHGINQVDNQNTLLRVVKPNTLKKYDNGNSVSGSGSSAPGSDNQIHGQSQGNRKYSYDEEGRLILQKWSTETSLTPQVNIVTDYVESYSWDERNRLVSVSRTTTVTTNDDGPPVRDSITQTTSSVQYQYDALDRRIGRIETEPSGKTRYFSMVYDPTGLVAELSPGEPARIDRRWLNGPAGVLAIDQADREGDAVHQKDMAGPTSSFWTFNDSQGSVETLAWINDSNNSWLWQQRLIDQNGQVHDTQIALQSEYTVSDASQGGWLCLPALFA